ncbi:MAG: SDR family oxidoreductase [Planctomycetota bacterium]|nr:SDR family oxidoreductase [Planctomycetota bacterium]
MTQNTNLPYSDAFRDTKALVTGGAGFIGSHIAQQLLDLGAQVTILDDLSSGHLANVPGGAQFTQASILDDDELKSATEGCTYVFHKAAMMSVPMSVEKPLECVEINIMGTERVLEAAKDLGVKRVVFAASSAAYGEIAKLPSHEDDPLDCHSPYAASKVAGELLMTAFSRCYDLSTISLRYFNVYGPRQDPKSAYAAVISAFSDALIHGRQPTVFGTGEQTRDFVHVDNIVHANLLAASCEKDLNGEVLNVGTGTRISLLQIIELMGKHLGVETDPSFGPPRAGDIMHTLPDISRAKELIGYEPLLMFEEGLKETLEWMQAQPV